MEGEQLLSIELHCCDQWAQCLQDVFRCIRQSQSTSASPQGCSCHRRDSNEGSEAQAAALLLPPIDRDPIFRHLCLTSVQLQRRGYFWRELGTCSPTAMGNSVTRLGEVQPPVKTKEEVLICMMCLLLKENKTIKDGDIAPWKDLQKIEQR